VLPADPLPVVSDRRSFVVVIGVDPHKRSHTASTLDPGTHRVLATPQVDTSPAGYRQLSRWAVRFGERRWAGDTARDLCRHLAQWLATRGEAGRRPPATARVSCPAAAPTG
jgi:transposase